jgi:hypothetical protein
MQVDKPAYAATYTRRLHPHADKTGEDESGQRARTTTKERHLPAVGQDLGPPALTSARRFIFLVLLGPSMGPKSLVRALLRL